MPICGVTDFVRAYTDAGRQYLTLGDPYASLFESSPKAPALVHLDSTDEGAEAAVEPVSCAGANPVQLGAYLGDTTGLVDEHYLVPARMGPVVIDEADLPAYLADLEFPVVFDGDLFADPARLASLVGAGEHR
ncbi:hypothetical protein [Halobaculum litoreum]|uniref:Uncharacterized protein n=1 Tax=Halobaculum litoreum TaxID=3031998 RepID=A0ABD5XRB2_9EURY|nr:hypothetical protein [Halobaculum sp. DT92]